MAILPVEMIPHRSSKAILLSLQCARMVETRDNRGRNHPCDLWAYIYVPGGLDVEKGPGDWHGDLSIDR